jgi:hypothetical protein
VSAVHSLEFWGLLMNAVGTVLVLIWPPAKLRYFRDGSRETQWARNPVPRGVLKYWLQEILWRTAVVLLIGGLVAQLYAVARK